MNALRGAPLRALLLASFAVLLPAWRECDLTLLIPYYPAYHLSSSTASFTATLGAGNPADQSVILYGPLRARAGTQWTAASDQSWLTVTPSSGSLDGQAESLLVLSVQVPAGQAEAWIGPTATAGAPSAREDHDAAYVGGRMVVWGGETSGTYLNTGGVYDPATNLWTGSTSMVGAPSVRTLHTLVGAGSEVIVWGGSTGASPSPISTYYQEGYRYSPATDTWLGTISTVGAPSARSFHSAVWTGSRMIVWGGYDGSTLVNTGGLYNPATNTWTATTTTNAPTPRLHHVAVWTGTDMIVWSGQDAGGNVIDGKKYNPGSDTWTPISSVGAPSARQAATAVWTGQEMVVWGGNATGASLNTGGRYDPAADTWTGAVTTVGAPGSRQSHSAVWTGTRMIVSHGAAVGGGFFTTGGLYQPAMTSVGVHTATVTIQPVDAPPLTILVTLTVTP